MPVQNTEHNERSDKARQLEHIPKRLPRVLPFQFLEDGFGILAKESDKRVFQRMFRFTDMAMLVNRNPIDRVAMIVVQIGVSLLMLFVNALVKVMAVPDRYRLLSARQSVQQSWTQMT